MRRRTGNAEAVSFYLRLPSWFVAPQNFHFNIFHCFLICLSFFSTRFVSIQNSKLIFRLPLWVVGFTNTISIWHILCILIGYIVLFFFIPFCIQFFFLFAVKCFGHFVYAFFSLTLVHKMKKKRCENSMEGFADNGNNRYEPMRHQEMAKKISFCCPLEEHDGWSVLLFSHRQHIYIAIHRKWQHRRGIKGKKTIIFLLRKQSVELKRQQAKRRHNTFPDPWERDAATTNKKVYTKNPNRFNRLMVIRWRRKWKRIEKYNDISVEFRMKCTH